MLNGPETSFKMYVSRYLFISVLVLSLIIANSQASQTSRSPAESSPTPPESITIDNGKEKCGIRKRINNTESEGHDHVQFGEFPWIVAILRTSISPTDGVQKLEYICSGSLLSKSVILTAANCLRNNLDHSTLRIRAGVYSLNNNTPDELPYQERKVKEIIIHGNFSSKLLYNNLALLSVEEPFNYESHIGRICAPLEGSPCTSLAPGSYDPNQCLVAGWEKTTLEIGGIPRKLRKNDVNLVPNDQCESILQTTRLTSKFKLHSSFVCAKDEINFDSCKHDDGGAPLVCALTSTPPHSTYVQVGVLSWSIPCGTMPKVYASLKANSEWLSTEFNNLNGNGTVLEKINCTSTT